MCGPFQLIWVKRKIFLAFSLLYGLNTLYRVVVQALEINQSRAFTKQNIPLYLLFLMNICGQVYLIIKYFLSCRSSNPKQYKQQMILPSYFSDILAFGATFSVSTQRTKNQNKEGKLLIAIPLRLLELF